MNRRNYNKWSHAQLTCLLDGILEKITENPEGFEVHMFKVIKPKKL